MGGNPFKVEIGAHDGVGVHRLHLVDRGRMPGVHEIHPLKHPGPGHKLLGASPFLRRTAEIDDGAVPAGLPQVLLHRHRRGQGSGSQGAVAAAVSGASRHRFPLHRRSRLLAQGCQGVVLSQNAHHRLSAPLAPGAGKAGGNPGHAGLHGKSLVPQHLLQPGGGFHLLKGQLRIGPNVVVRLYVFSAVGVHVLFDPLSVAHFSLLRSSIIQMLPFHFPAAVSPPPGASSTPSHSPPGTAPWSPTGRSARR